uniref:Uncharacterized protein n=1 Tax=Rhodymenia pseudopalmata TaxID=31502 RepID=V9NGC0_RHOPU|nr:hypothetical protein Rhody.mt.35 [Rhodymenia pseudopalmata]AGO19278.1 hypothetical protein Rhody.mt.35 [Rhodymenia pseudopalmata]
MKIARLKSYSKHVSIFDSLDKNPRFNNFFKSKSIQIKILPADKRFKIVSNESLLKHILIMEFFSGQKTKIQNPRTNFSKPLIFYLTCRGIQKYKFLDICLNSLLLSDKILNLQNFSLSWEIDFFISSKIVNKLYLIRKPVTGSIFSSQ